MVRGRSEECKKLLESRFRYGGIENGRSISTPPVLRNHAYRQELISCGLDLFLGTKHEGSVKSVVKSVAGWHKKSKEWANASLTTRDNERAVWRGATGDVVPYAALDVDPFDVLPSDPEFTDSQFCNEELDPFGIGYDDDFPGSGSAA